MKGPTITRAEYLAAFEAWFTAAGCRNGISDLRPLFDAAVAAGGLPDAAPVSDFCAILDARIPFPATRFTVGKSSMLDRLLYGREKLRTVKCPKHDGRWTGIPMPPDWPNSNHCKHGCQLTGWLPAVSP